MIASSKSNRKKLFANPITLETPEITMKKPARQNRSDQLVARARKDIAKHYGLPVECVRLVLPSNRRANENITIGRLRWLWTR
jgi:hypothetical protein